VSITLENGQRFGSWSDIEMSLGLDSYSALSLSGPFDYERKEVREAFQPLMFPKVTVNIGDELIMTGRVKDVSPTVDAGASSVGVTVYSLPFDLLEVCPPPDLLPLEFSGLDLRQIARRLVTAAVGVDVVFDAQPGAKFAKIRCEPDAVVHGFLVELAQQRGYVLSDLSNGDLLFRSEAFRGKPVARLEGQPIGKVSATFQPSSWFQRVTGRASQKVGKAGSSYSALNPLYKPLFPARTFTFAVDDTEAADVPKAVTAAIGRMMAQVVTYTVEDLPTWRDPQDALWRVNTTVTLKAPEAMVYRETELLIRSVRFRQTPEAETATLELVLPGSFGGFPALELPWDI
jgi:prophage tail gpP-like protein